MDTAYLTPRHEALRHSVRDFALAEIAPRIAAMEATGAVDHEASALIARQGWMGATIGTAYSGMGAGHLAKTLIVEELSRVSGAMGAMAQASQLGVAKLLHYGDEGQKSTWLPALADGSILSTIAVTETGSGGHVLGMKSTGRRRGREYVLDGTKVFVGNSHIGGLHGVVVNTGGRRSKALSAFLVESDRPGFSLKPHRPALGLHGFSFGELVLDRCRVPAANRIGEEGDGLAVAYSSSILYGRPNLTAVSLGLHQAIMDETLAFVQDRRRYDGPLSALSGVQRKVGQMQSRLMTARLAAYDSVHRLDHGLPCDAELINAKHVNVEATLDSARTAMEIHAAAGLQTDRPLERLLRDAFHTYAPAGTGDIQLHRLSEHALGEGRSPWSTQHVSALAAEAWR
jgi:alkylation response protein AidB-like acyl-CoA dehydrogenase